MVAGSGASVFFFSSRRRHTSCYRDWSSDVCSSDLGGRIELGLTQENGAVAVSVADTGPGITPAERGRIFRPFWSRDGRGTGLGLAIANELAQALGGQIVLETEVGRGSTFELVLPSS